MLQVQFYKYNLTIKILQVQSYNYNFTSTILQLQFYNYNFTSTILQLQFYKYNLTITILQVQSYNYNLTTPFLLGLFCLSNFFARSTTEQMLALVLFKFYVHKKKLFLSYDTLQCRTYDTLQHR
jgi:hypothetical protein